MYITDFDNPHARAWNAASRKAKARAVELEAATAADLDNFVNVMEQVGRVTR